MQKKAFDKSPRTIGLEEIDVSKIKAILDKPIANVILNDGSNVEHQDLNTKACIISHGLSSSEGVSQISRRCNCRRAWYQGTRDGCVPKTRLMEWGGLFEESRSHYIRCDVFHSGNGLVKSPSYPDGVLNLSDVQWDFTVYNQREQKVKRSAHVR